MILIPAMTGMSIMWNFILLGIEAVSAMGVVEAMQGVEEGGGDAPTACVPFRNTPAQKVQSVAESRALRAERMSSSTQLESKHMRSP